MYRNFNKKKYIYIEIYCLIFASLSSLVRSIVEQIAKQHTKITITQRERERECVSVCVKKKEKKLQFNEGKIRFLNGEYAYDTLSKDRKKQSKIRNKN